MNHLRLVAEEPDAGPFDTGSPLPSRLPPGRHGIPKNLVAEHQRRRLIAGMAEALAEHGYATVTASHVSARAGVSSRTFYKHFGNLWDCLLAAYVATANHLCEQVEGAADPEQDSASLAAGIDAALAFVAARPAQGRLLSTQPPREAVAIAAARRRLIERLATMLHDERGADEVVRPPGLDERLIDAALVFVGSRIAAGEAEQLSDLGPELTAILAGPRRQAA
jgi:AcrR family transcriptional regulator